jgi:hypothetical protein
MLPALSPEIGTRVPLPCTRMSPNPCPNVSVQPERVVGGELQRGNRTASRPRGLVCVLTSSYVKRKKRRGYPSLTGQSSGSLNREMSNLGSDLPFSSSSVADSLIEPAFCPSFPGSAHHALALLLNRWLARPRKSGDQAYREFST